MRSLLLPVILISGLVTSCAVFTPIPANQFVKVEKMQVSPVSVTLLQKHENPVFYNQQEIESYMTQCLIEQLTAQGRYQVDADAVLDTVIGYRRAYSGQLFGNKESITKPTMSYIYQIKDGNNILQGNNEDVLQLRTDILDNAKSMMAMDNDNTEKSSENVYLDALCRRIAYKIY